MTVFYLVFCGRPSLVVLVFASLASASSFHFDRPRKPRRRNSVIYFFSNPWVMFTLINRSDLNRRAHALGDLVLRILTFAIAVTAEERRNSNRLWTRGRSLLGQHMLSGSPYRNFLLHTAFPHVLAIRMWSPGGRLGNRDCFAEDGLLCHGSLSQPFVRDQLAKR